MKKTLTMVGLLIFTLGVLIFIFPKNVYAATGANLSASKMTVTTGSTFTVSVNVVDSASWVLHVSADSGLTLQSESSSASLADTSSDTNNTSKTLDTLTYKASKAGKYSISLTGQCVDQDVKSTPIDTSISIIVTDPAPANTNTNTNTNTNKTNTTTNTTPVAPVKSSDATLKSLTTSPSGITPKFSASTLKYALTVDSTVTKVTVTAAVNNSKATYKTTGNTNLQTGTNIIKVVVTAENGTTKTYQITVTKKAPSDIENNIISTTPPINVVDNNITAIPTPKLGLSSLAITEIDELSPAFSTNTYYYIGNLQSWADSVDVTAIANQDGATVEITGNTNLIEGDNLIVVTVKSKDGKETASYNITLNNPIKTDDNVIATSSNTIVGSDNSNTSNFFSMLKDNISMMILAIVAFIIIIVIIIIIIKLAQGGQSDNLDKEEQKDVSSTNSKKGKRHKEKGEE
ncbi:MAG: cadherin-like beta sandwich domain-containing protein [Oscillospiraceae bacterium]|nr:cadherin-like beta sandwich domain-containing protein [Oscillospiraceae bacterium]